MTKYSEPELVVPALYVIERNPWIATSDLIVELEEMLAPDGEDQEILAGRNDSKFSQKVRNLVSHHTMDQEGFGYIQSKQEGRNWFHKITPEGVTYLRDHLDELPKLVDQHEETNHIAEDYGTGVEIEETTGEELITKPFDPTFIRVDSKPFTIDLLLRRIRENEVNMAPDFQRKAGIWNEGAQSRLIESILIRIPLPAFYMDATDDEHWTVVDGLQRLTALKRFAIDKTLRLVELEFLANLENKTYDDLPRGLQRRIQETQITVYLIEEGTPPEVKFNIFKRINTGGLPLSSQEIRHALNQGKATSLLADLAASDEFKSATSHGIKDDRMADRECVLRFIAYTLTSYRDYKSNDFDGFLNETMAALNRMPDRRLNELGQQFLRTMKAAKDIFGDNAFRKRYSLTGGRYPINKALFEAWAVNLNKLDADEVKRLREQKAALTKGFVSLMNDRDFDRAVSQGTGDAKKVRLRFGAIEKLIKETLA